MRADEIGHAARELSLFRGQNRGMRQRHAHRMAEQRDHSEPIGHAANTRRLGKSFDITEPRPIGVKSLQIQGAEPNKDAQSE